jgi:hypothetical protein
LLYLKSNYSVKKEAMLWEEILPGWVSTVDRDSCTTGEKYFIWRFICFARFGQIKPVLEEKTVTK